MLTPLTAGRPHGEARGQLRGLDLDVHEQPALADLGTLLATLADDRTQDRHQGPFVFGEIRVDGLVEGVMHVLSLPSGFRDPSSDCGHPYISASCETCDRNAKKLDGPPGAWPTSHDMLPAPGCQPAGPYLDAIASTL